MAKSQLTTEDVRDAATNLWALGMVEHFDAWLDRHDRETAAKALREAAHALAEYGQENHVTVGDPDDDDTWVTLTVHEWLDARADRIGAGDGS